MTCVLFLALVTHVVTCEEYGAIGDGRHDDRKAIVAAHAAANEKNLTVRARDGATYYVGAGTECATVCTDVDFGYVCHLPHKVEIDGLYIDDSANPGKAVLFGDITGGEKPDATYPIRRCEEVVLKNVKTASGKPPVTFANPAAFASTKVIRVRAEREVKQ